MGDEDDSEEDYGESDRRRSRRRRRVLNKGGRRELSSDNECSQSSGCIEKEMICTEQPKDSALR